MDSPLNRGRHPSCAPGVERVMRSDFAILTRPGAATKVAVTLRDAEKVAGVSAAAVWSGTVKRQLQQTRSA
jgi:hypothetical protein